MLWLIRLYNLAANKSAGTFVHFEQDVIQPFTGFQGESGFHYLGLYEADSRNRMDNVTPWGELPFRYAEVYAAQGSSRAEAQTRWTAIRPSPEVNDILAKRRSYVAADSPQAELWLEPLALSPIVETSQVLTGRLIQLMLYRPLPDKSVEDFIRFEKRITATYANYMGKIDWSYFGVYHAYGLQDYMRADVYSIGAASPDEALARDDAYPATPEIAEINTECRSFMNRQIERFKLWLRPIVLSPSASAGIILAPQVGAGS